jgi:hypothetical protein
LNWETWRRILIRVCVLTVPVSMAAGAAFVVADRGPGYDIWTWAAIGAFNGAVIGVPVTVWLRIIVAAIDWRG